jgi:hypothetical protein
MMHEHSQRVVRSKKNLCTRCTSKTKRSRSKNSLHWFCEAAPSPSREKISKRTRAFSSPLAEIDDNVTAFLAGMNARDARAREQAHHNEYNALV